LKAVAVAGQNTHRIALKLGFLSQGSNDIIGLVTRNFQPLQPQQTYQLLDFFQLRVKIVRGGSPMGLVLLKCIVPKGFGWRVEDHNYAVAIFLEQLQQGAEKAKNGLGWLPPRGGEFPKGKVAAVGQVVPIHQPDETPLGWLVGKQCGLLHTSILPALSLSLRQ